MNKAYVLHKLCFWLLCVYAVPLYLPKERVELKVLIFVDFSSKLVKIKIPFAATSALIHHGVVHIVCPV